MNLFSRAALYASLTGLAVVSAAVAPAMAQTKTFPPGTDCSRLTGADITACQNQMSSQQRGGAGAAGAAPAQTTPGNTGNGTPNPANGGVNNDSTIGPSGGVPNTGGTNPNGNSNGTRNSNGTSNP
jgi:hypothetical protein